MTSGDKGPQPVTYPLHVHARPHSRLFAVPLFFVPFVSFVVNSVSVMASLHESTHPLPPESCPVNPRSGTKESPTRSPRDVDSV